MASDHVQAVIVRVAEGSVLPLGLGALLRAVQDAGRACTAHRSISRMGPQGIDLWNADIARPRTFAYLRRALHEGWLDRLRLMRLCGVGLVDAQVLELACVLGRHPSLEILSVANNSFTAYSGVALFETFVSMRCARALDVSCNALGDAMVTGIIARLSSGTPWKLQALWLAYCSLTQAGLKDASTIVRAGVDSLEHLVISGVARMKCDAWGFG